MILNEFFHVIYHEMLQEVYQHSLALRKLVTQQLNNIQYQIACEGYYYINLPFKNIFIFFTFAALLITFELGKIRLSFLLTQKLNKLAQQSRTLLRLCKQ